MTHINEHILSKEKLPNKLMFQTVVLKGMISFVFCWN